MLLPHFEQGVAAWVRSCSGGVAVRCTSHPTPHPRLSTHTEPKAVVFGHCLVTLSFTINETTALIAAHLNAGVTLVVTV